MSCYIWLSKHAVVHCAVKQYQTSLEAKLVQSRILGLFYMYVNEQLNGSRLVPGTAAVCRRRFLLRFQTFKTVKIPAPNC